MTTNAHVSADAITAKIGAASLPLGIILFVISTAIFHPHEQNAMNDPAVFLEYAQSDDWIAIHFVQWFAALFLIGGLISLYYIMAGSQGAGVALARFGLVGTVMTGTAFTMLQAVDGVALKWQ